MSGKKRTFGELRHLILANLLTGQQTTNQISIKTGINWRTVELHLTFLIGKRLVSEVLKSQYVRIFELTASGKEYAHQLVQEAGEAVAETGAEAAVEAVANEQVVQP